MIRLRINKERRLILIAGAVLLLLGGLYQSSFFEELTGREELGLKLQRIMKYQDRIPQKVLLEKKRRALTKQVETLQESLLQGGTPALAAVSMQNRLNEIAANLGLEIRSTRVLKPEFIKNTDLIAVDIQFTTDLTVKQLKQLLYEIEYSGRPLQVKALQLRKTSAAPMVQLQASITIEGLMLNPASGG